MGFHGNSKGKLWFLMKSDGWDLKGISWEKVLSSDPTKSQ